MSLPIISIRTDLDPRLLQVNRRIKGGHWIPTPTREAMRYLSDLAREQLSTGNWQPSRASTYDVRAVFTFPTMASDIDGPVKRTLDAAFRGMREAIDLPQINDARVVTLHVAKRTGEPSLTLLIAEVDTPAPGC